VVDESLGYPSFVAYLLQCEPGEQPAPRQQSQSGALKRTIRTFELAGHVQKFGRALDGHEISICKLSTTVFCGEKARPPSLAFWIT
jgi:hypothetical protein